VCVCVVQRKSSEDENIGRDAVKRCKLTTVPVTAATAEHSSDLTLTTAAAAAAAAGASETVTRPSVSDSEATAVSNS